VKKLENWDALAQRIYAKSLSIFDGAELTATDAGTADPKVVALSLLARSISNFKAANLLLDEGQIVEARTIARCCYENLFWIAALANKGDEFVKAMETDDARSRKTRAKNLLDWASRQPSGPDFVETLQKFAASLNEDHPKPKRIEHSQAAEDGGIGDGYIIYSELSNDSAHPSATSLSRYVKLAEHEEPPFSLHCSPQTDASEEEETVEFLCSALLGVAVGANQIVGGQSNGERLDALALDLRKLSESSAATRKAK